MVYASRDNLAELHRENVASRIAEAAEGLASLPDDAFMRLVRWAEGIAKGGKPALNENGELAEEERLRFEGVARLAMVEIAREAHRRFEERYTLPQ